MTDGERRAERYPELDDELSEGWRFYIDDRLIENTRVRREILAASNQGAMMAWETAEDILQEAKLQLREERVLWRTRFRSLLGAFEGYMAGLVGRTEAQQIRDTAKDWLKGD